jgi:hypothetical protein
MRGYRELPGRPVRDRQDLNGVHRALPSFTGVRTALSCRHEVERPMVLFS